MSVEIMASRLRNNKDIKGFQIKIDETTHSIKISQLADDTTLFCTSKEEIFFTVFFIVTKIYTQCFKRLFIPFNALYFIFTVLKLSYPNFPSFIFVYQLCCLSCQWKSWLQDLETIKILRDFK
jgi:hypothetical protein